jgi:hypothetical protein
VGDERDGGGTRTQEQLKIGLMWCAVDEYPLTAEVDTPDMVGHCCTAEQSCVSI